MATEILSIPEEHLEEVIKVLKSGLKRIKVSYGTKYNLQKWIKQEEEYLSRLEEE